MGAGAGGGRPRGRVGCGAREEGSGWLKEPGGQPRGCPGFLLKGQVGGDRTAELGFLGRREVTCCPHCPRGSWSPHLTRCRTPCSPGCPPVLAAHLLTGLAFCHFVTWHHPHQARHPSLGWPRVVGAHQVLWAHGGTNSPPTRAGAALCPAHAPSTPSTQGQQKRPQTLHVAAAA